MRRSESWVLSSLALIVMAGSAGAQASGNPADDPPPAGRARPPAVALSPAVQRDIGEGFPGLVGERVESRVVAPARVDSAAAVTHAAMRAGVAAPVHAAAPAPTAAAGRLGLGQARAMMVVGGAAVILGAIIGDTPGTLFMVGGTVIGLVGLYEYLR